MAYNRAFVEHQQEIREEILMRIYSETHKNSTAWNRDFVYRRELVGKVMCCPLEDAAFALAYLVKCGHVAVNGMEYSITHAGIVAIEAQLMNIQGD